MAIIFSCAPGPRQPDDEMRRVARQLGFERAFDQPAEQYIPEAPEELFEGADVVAVREWDYQNYLIFTFVDNTRALPLTLVAYQCDPSGRVEDWSGRIRFETKEPENAFAKLRFIIANDAYTPEFCESQIY